MKDLLSPRDLAESIGVSESSVKRWADRGTLEVMRTAGGHRRITRSEAIRFIRETGATLVHPEILGVPDLEALNGQVPARADRDEALYQLLLDGRAPEARGLILSMYLSGESIGSLCDGPVRSALERLGELWKEDADGIFLEHRATDICVQGLNQVRLLLTVPDDAPVAVGGAPAGDPYLIPTMMAATSLADVGFEAINLGPDTPLDALRRAALQHDAQLIWLSLTGEVDDPRGLTAAIADLAAALAPSGVSLIVGGAALERESGIHPAASFHVGRSMAELAAFARGVLASNA